jgi:hypothetical protein
MMKWFGIDFTARDVQNKLKRITLGKSKGFWRFGCDWRILQKNDFANLKYYFWITK